MTNSALRRVVFPALLAAACAHTPSTPAARCVASPEHAATRVPVLDESAPCGEQSGRKAMDDACAGGDPHACHRFSTCLVEDANGREMWARESFFRDALPRLAKACQAGVAESCLLRAELRFRLGEAQRATCDDLLRAVHLGDTTGVESCKQACE